MILKTTSIGIVVSPRSLRAVLLCNAVGGMTRFFLLPRLCLIRWGLPPPCCAGTQACKALKQEGYQVVLLNSNPATIMTDPGTADRTYVAPMTPELATKIIEQERPDALLPTMGGQTALNLAVSLSESGVLEK